MANHIAAKPSIFIYVCPHDRCQEKLREVTAGMEEEGIPYKIVNSDEQAAVKLAYEGAAKSQLGVGIGIGPTEICLHYEKLPPAKPLFYNNQQDNPLVWRCFGYNAARLVKGIPFKTVLSPKQASPEVPVEKPQESLALYRLVSSIVNKVLQETAQSHGGGVAAWSSKR